MLGHRKLSPEDYLAILKRRWPLALIPAIIVPVLAFAVTFVIPAEYLSKTLVLIESQRVAAEFVQPIVAADLDNRLATMKEQILSRSRIQPIVDRYNLYANKHMTLDDRIDLARKSIGVIPIHAEIGRAGSLPGFNITFKASDAHTAQLVCSEITSLFINENLRATEASSEGTTDFLKSQLEDAKRNLDEQDAKLAAFQREYVGKLPGEENTNVNMLTSINTQLQAATQDLSRMEQAKSYEESMLSQQVANAQAPASSVFTSTPSVSAASSPQQAELQGLLASEAELTTKYTSDYPDVIQVRRKIADLRKEIARSQAPASLSGTGSLASPARTPDSPAIAQLRAQLRATDIGIDEKRREQNQLQKSLGMYQDRISSSPLVQEQFKELTRDYQTAQTFYNNLLTEMNHAKMSTDLQRRQQGEQFDIVDQANLPDSPTFPNRTLFTLAGLVGGLAIGLMIIGVLEYRDTALRDEQDIWAFTKLPTLAVIAYIAAEQPFQPEKRGLFARFNPFSRKPQPAQS